MAWKEKNSASETTFAHKQDTYTLRNVVYHAPLSLADPAEGGVEMRARKEILEDRRTYHAKCLPVAFVEETGEKRLKMVRLKF